MQFYRLFNSCLKFLPVNKLLMLHILINSFITARCTLVQSAVLRSHVVCLSVRLSVCICNVGELWSHRLEFFENNFTTVSLACLLFATNPNITGLLQGEHQQIFGRIGVWCWKSGIRHTKALISLKRGKIGPRLPLKSNMKSYTGFDWCQNQWPWMTLKGHYALCFKTRASFGAQCENLNEDRSILSATKM